MKRPHLPLLAPFILQWHCNAHCCSLVRCTLLIAENACIWRRFTGEVDLHRVVVTRLLPVLTQRSAICMCLVRLEAWHALIQGFAGQAEPIRALAGPTARALAKTLVVASSGLKNIREGQDYINHLLRPLVGVRSFAVTFHSKQSRAILWALHCT